MDRIEIGDIELIGQQSLLRIVITTRLSESTWSVDGAKAAVGYLQAWIAEQEGRAPDGQYTYWRQRAEQAEAQLDLLQQKPPPVCPKHKQPMEPSLIRAGSYFCRRMGCEAHWPV